MDPTQYFKNMAEAQLTEGEPAIEPKPIYHLFNLHHTDYHYTYFPELTFPQYLEHTYEQYDWNRTIVRHFVESGQEDMARKMTATLVFPRSLKKYNDCLADGGDDIQCYEGLHTDKRLLLHAMHHLITRFNAGIYSGKTFDYSDLNGFMMFWDRYNVNKPQYANIALVRDACDGGIEALDACLVEHHGNAGKCVEAWDAFHSCWYSTLLAFSLSMTKDVFFRDAANIVMDHYSAAPHAGYSVEQEKTYDDLNK